MEDRFDYETLWRVVAHLRRESTLIRFSDLLPERGCEPERFVLLRHDVDYSPEAALKLAEREASRGILASYFLLPNSIYYNLLDPEHAELPSRLVGLGHEVGLHYDVRFLHAFPRHRWGELLERQVELLAGLSGAPVVSIAMHQPALLGDDPFAGRFLNAYDDRFFKDIEYVSDSCRAWRDRGWTIVSGGAVPPRLQLVLHPINWDERDRPRRAVFEQAHRQLRGRITRLERELLAQIAVHAGVGEHEARLGRPARRSP